MSGIKLNFCGRSSWLSDSGYTKDEQAKIYDDVLDDVIANPRWYLDQLSYLAEFKVYWIDYAKQKVTRPHRFVNHRKPKAL